MFASVNESVRMNPHSFAKPSLVIMDSFAERMKTAEEQWREIVCARHSRKGGFVPGLESVAVAGNRTADVA